MKIFGMVTTSHSAKYTDHALRSFFENTNLDPEDEFHLIDNDGSFDPEKLRSRPQAFYVKNQSPLSFSANANQMVIKALENEADLYFLNNDVIFTPNWINPLLIREDSILSPICNRELQYDSNVFKSKLVMELEDYLGKEDGLKRLVEVHRSQRQGTLQVIALPFFCVKIPHKILHDVGLFDQEFGKGGGEDYDYCLRAYLAGYRVKYALPSYLLHFGGKSTYSGAESREQQEQRELKFRTYFGVKWGMDLLKLIMFEDESVISQHEGLWDLIQKGNQRQVIQALKSDQRVPIKISANSEL